MIKRSDSSIAFIPMRSKSCVNLSSFTLRTLGLDLGMLGVYRRIQFLVTRTAVTSQHRGLVVLLAIVCWVKLAPRLSARATEEFCFLIAYTAVSFFLFVVHSSIY